MNDLLEIASKIGLSALLAGAIGAEREWTGKAAGLRTHMLIAVGAALLTDVSIGIGPATASGSTAWDPGRIAAQIVSGVGFIGAGTIIQARGGVRGLTTAAGLWVAAAIGLAVGAGFFAEAAVTSGVLLVILVLLRPVEEHLLQRNRRHLVVELLPEQALADLVDLLEEVEVEPEGLDVQERHGDRFVSVVFRGSEGKRAELARRLDEKGFATRPRPGGRGAGPLG
jgi:putative Mg2+ transporter-C (MgtC) family protein